MTKRANGEGTSYQQPDGRWAAQVYVRTPEGTKRRKTIRGDTQREVLRELRSIREKVDKGLPVSTRRSPTLKDFGTDWIQKSLPQEVLLGHLSPRTADNYTTVWMTHIEPSLGHLRLDQITPAHVRDWLAFKTNSNSRIGKPLSQRSLQLMHAVLRRALRDAMRDEHASRNVATLVPSPKAERHLVEPLTRAEAQLVLKAAGDHDLGALWLLLLSLGLRLGEGLALRWDDVDLDSGSVNICRSVGRVRGTPDAEDHRATHLAVGKTKTLASSTLLALPAATVAALRKHRASQARAQMAAASWEDPNLVFTTRSGGHLDGRNVGRAWTSFAKQAGIKRKTWPHLLRHSAATFLLLQGVPMEVIKATLRHTRLATTMDLYAHVTEELQRTAADAMDQFLAEAVGEAGT